MSEYNKFPKIIIEFCAKCKWHNRAIWYSQEIMQTFNDPNKNLIADISIQPNYETPGTFQITLIKNENDIKILYKRKFKKAEVIQDDDYYFDGFPDSKFLKSLIRDSLFPHENLGHIDKYSQGNLLIDERDIKKENNNESVDNSECIDCKKQE